MVNDKQYVISKRQLIFGDWQHIELKDGYILSYHEKLNVNANSDYSVLILGDAWQSDPNQKSPYVIINNWDENTDQDTIYQTEESWCGRYVLIVGTKIYQDATSQLTCFYDDCGSVSSSLNILGGGEIS